MRFTDDLGAEISVTSQLGPAVAISADGLRIAYSTRDLDGKNRLAQRSAGSSKSVVYAGTEGAVAPFFKPDGKWIAFFADQRLKKISVEGGPVVTLSDASSSRGGTWSQRELHLFR
jgi:serine/threonine-protein kinase